MTLDFILSSLFLLSLLSAVAIVFIKFHIEDKKETNIPSNQLGILEDATIGYVTYESMDDD